ncbi:MAG: ABC transporter permease subunit [Limisphaerales bacterium]
MGPQIYAAVAHIALMMCMLTGSATADALSSEKRNGTLGLLFLTDLKGYDIVFGKLAATGLLSVLGFVAVIPILAIPVLMGGISGQNVLRTALTLLNALFFSLSIGLWVSSRSWEHKRARNSTLRIAILFLWVLPGLAAALRYRFHWGQLADFLYMLSPVYQQDHATPFGLGMRTDRFWQSLAITHGLAWLALWRACTVLPLAWHDRVVVDATGRWTRFWHNLRLGAAEGRARFRERLLNINAVHWLSAREISQPLRAWAFLAIIVLSWVLFSAWLKFSVPKGPPFWGVGIPAVLAMMLGLRMRASALAAEFIARDRFSGALELLLSTTLTERDIARGQWRTFERTLAGPAIFSVLIGAGVFVAAMISTENFNHSTTPFLVFFGLAILFPLDLAASVWTGMWTACITRTPTGAPAHSLMRLLLIPQVLFVAVMTPASILPWGENLEFLHVFAGWWVICVLNSFYWLICSRRNFYALLRRTASESYQPQARPARWWRLEFSEPTSAQ